MGEVMPRYDYRCSNGHEFERYAGIDDDTVECPFCGKEAQRLAVYKNQAIITETGVGHG